MSEQKYYVKLNLDAMYYLQDWSGHESVNYIYFWLDKTCEFVPTSDRAEFTKSELAEIMDGAIYKPDGENCVREGGTDRYDDNEWINPLIKLVPVEEEK